MKKRKREGRLPQIYWLIKVRVFLNVLILVVIKP